jgi:hypothetical protein
MHLINHYSLPSLLCLHWLSPGNSSQHWRFLAIMISGFCPCCLVTASQQLFIAAATGHCFLGTSCLHCLPASYHSLLSHLETANHSLLNLLFTDFGLGSLSSIRCSFQFFFLVFIFSPNKLISSA